MNIFKLAFDFLLGLAIIIALLWFLYEVIELLRAFNITSWQDFINIFKAWF